MLKSILLPALLLAAGETGALHAQTDYYARAGAIWASNLVRDVLVSEVTVQQSIAPMVALGASTPISPGYRAGLEATFESGGFSSEQDGSETDLGRVQRLESELLRECWKSAEHKEAVAAFLAKRPPKFR